MPTSQKSRSKDTLVQNPGKFGNALANVLSLEGGREVVLGQAWLAAPGRLVTCGHVVERFVNAPSLLIVRFPQSGNKYQIKSIRLHPNYIRQPDQLVKYDAAVLEVVLQMPESAASPLPFSYEQEITTNEKLWAIHYPTHLGALSGAPHPLTQDGRYLGPLRTNDTFHLLHDLPLAPGDSGAPISDGASIVAIHCGDTATLPGLNLPTTSIRLALWVDALRDLGLGETQKPSGSSGGSAVLPAIIAFALSAVLAGAAAWMYFGEEAKKAWAFGNNPVMPFSVSFNEPVDRYQLNEDVVITITPSAKTYLYCFAVDSKDNVCVLYPQFGQDSHLVNKGEQRIINQFGSTKLTANPSKDMFYIVSVRGESSKGESLNREIIKQDDWPPHPKEGMPLLTKGKDLLSRISKLKSENADDVMLVNFVGPHSP